MRKFLKAKVTKRSNTALALTAVVLVIFVAYFISNRDNFRPLLHINIWLLFLIAAIDIAVIAANGLFTRAILQPFGKVISYAESFFLSMISSVGNFFAPAGAGFVFRAIYLKRKHNFSYQNYVSILFGNYIIVFIVNSLAGLAALALLRQHDNREFKTLAATFGFILVMSLALTFLRLKAEPSKAGGTKAWFMNNLKRVSSGWRTIYSHPRLMARLFGTTLLNLGLITLMYLAIAKSLHFNVSFAALLLLSALNALSLFINVTPGNLGIKEAVYLFSANVMGLSVSQILSIAVIDRGVQFVVLAVAWLAFGRRTLSANKVELAQKL